MNSVVIYTTSYCPYCVRAKSLLQQKGVAFEEISVEDNSEKREEMIAKSGRKTVPQIFIDNVAIGGCDDLYALEQNGQLNKLLNGED